jgi:light-regulated signal transduction histidine kinase (bacteriophytochrome)
MGLISDLNGSIILKIKNLDELDLINNQLRLKNAELEDFIYRTSHDLRGPLATIRGLVNLIRARKDNEELEMLIGLMAERTDKLNERLSQLLYLTLAGREVSTPNNIVDFKVIENKVRKIANQNEPAFIKLDFLAPEGKLHGLNEILIQALIISLLQHTLSLPMSQLERMVSIIIVLDNNSLNVGVESIGFIVDETLKEALSKSEFIYSDIMNYPQLVNYYAAQKIASGLQAQVHFHLHDDKQQLSTSIPVQNSLKNTVNEPAKLEIFG